MANPNKKSGIYETKFEQDENKLKELNEELDNVKNKLNLFFDGSPDMVTRPTKKRSSMYLNDSTPGKSTLEQV